MEDKNFEVVKRNWSGSEFQKAEPKLLQIGKTIDRALADQRQQRNY